MPTRLFLYATLFTMCAFADTVNYTYDNAGRLVRVGYAGGASILYTYDAAGNLLRRVVTTASTEPASAGTAPNAGKTKPAKRSIKASAASREARTSAPAQ